MTTDDLRTFLTHNPDTIHPDLSQEQFIDLVEAHTTYRKTAASNPGQISLALPSPTLPPRQP